MHGIACMRSAICMEDLLVAIYSWPGIFSAFKSFYCDMNYEDCDSLLYKALPFLLVPIVR